MTVQAQHSHWINSKLSRTLQAVGVEPNGFNYFIEAINPQWSLTQLHAKVLRVVDETHDTKSFVLRPNHLWQGVKAGQHIGVAVQIDGRWIKRRYSLSKAEADNAKQAETVQITVKRVPGGVVSNFLHDHVATGAVLRLDAADGDFVIPDALPEKLLVLTAGSGITPVFSQVATLLNRGYQGSIEFIHYVRSPQDRIFGKQLQALAEQYPNFSVQWCFETAEGQSKPERFSTKQLAKRVADYQTRHALLCGPAGFMAAVREHWDAIAATERLAFEYFGMPPVDDAEAVDAEITLKSGRQIALNAGQTLLDALLESGETPKYGCRRGVCHECKCRKTQGAVKNLLTGQISGAGEEDIQLCISAPVSDVTLG